MHIEFLVEDSSGAKLLEALLPRLLGEQGEPHTWRLHAYKGVGRIPRGLKPGTDAAKRILSDRLRSLLSGYGKTPGIDAVVIVLDADDRNCAAFLAELKALASSIRPAPHTLFRLAIEEIEAWYLGDREALLAAYPDTRQAVLREYRQDSVCGTWELLADATFPGGIEAVRKKGWPLPGEIKHEWATRIGPLLDPARNTSPSFQKLCEGLRRLTASRA